MEETVALLSQKFPMLHYTASTAFCWSPERQEISFKSTNIKPHFVWSLLHETGHALLAHTSYRTDLELIRLEVAAWERAQELGAELGIEISNDYVQDCLDTYRDWLHQRSLCPSCSNKSLQQGDVSHYRCFNCHAIWQVTPSRFCRSYRSSVPQKKPVMTFQATHEL